ncbi:phytoene desaturase family protein [Mycobacterium sp. pUA109]|uniref:phytoene desaturase family protein n=1 Tax=Mycobacterium sp. pUA109 TaxID=3238982 RepID=UPI00351B000F
MNSKISRDVIVIGAGHNGLTAAAYLAKAGRKVTVLEASPVIGGMLGSNSIIPGAPNHIHNEGGIQASLFRASSITKDLNLDRYGLVQLPADPYHVHLEPEGASLAFWQDPRCTAEEIRHFSPRDARAFLKFATMLDAAMDIGLPLLLGHPTRPAARAVSAAVTQIAKHRRELAPLTRFFVSGHQEIIEEWFDHPLLRAALAAMPPFCWMTQDGTGWALIYLGICHRIMNARFQGGSVALPRALAACLKDHGGDVRLSARVEELIVTGGAVTGVRLRDGEELSAGYVMAACSPVVTLNRLLPEGTLSEDLERRASVIPTTNTGAGNLKVDFAFSGRIEMTKHNRWRKDGLDLRQPVVSWHTYDEHLQGWNDSVARRWPAKIPFISIVPTAIDPTQAPDGQDTCWIWSGIVPSRPDVPWSEVREDIGEQVVNECAQYYDNFRDAEIGRRVFLAPDLAERFNVPGGNVYHVDPFLLRFGPARPAIGLSKYETPVPGLYLTGAGTHPTGGISGIPGQQAALRLLRRSQDPARLRLARRS